MSGFQKANPGRSPRIVLVGPCASGKSALAEGLRRTGHSVRVCGQEHSGVRNLWLRMDPDVLVALDIDLDTLRARRSPHWPDWLYQLQRTRLKDAFDAADVTIDTSVTSIEASVSLVAEVIARKTSIE